MATGETRVVYQGVRWRVTEDRVPGWGPEFTVEWETAGRWVPGKTFPDRGEAIEFVKGRETA